MCGRITLRVPMSVLAQTFDFQYSASVELTPRYNIPPGTNLAVVVQKVGARQFDYMKWGLVPSWSKDEKKSASFCKFARAETIAEKPSYRSAFKKQRCLILADGYFEWDEYPKIGKWAYFYEINGGEPFAIAGLWESWQGPSGNDAPLLTCVPIMTDPNSLCAEHHDRMPVILHKEDYQAWLDPQTDPGDVKGVLRQYEKEAMSVKSVGNFVNAVKNQGPQCIEAVPEPMLF